MDSPSVRLDIDTVLGVNREEKNSSSLFLVVLKKKGLKIQELFPGVISVE